MPVESPDPTPPPTDRDTRGRFAPGNRASRGNAVWRRQGELHRAVREAIKDADLHRVFAAMFEAATKGDVAAASLLVSYAIGRPREAEPSFAPVDLPKMDSCGGVHDALQVVTAGAASGYVPLDVARQLADLVDRVGQAGAYADLARRVDALQAMQGHRP